MTHHRAATVLLLCFINFFGFHTVRGWQNPELVPAKFRLHLVDTFEWQKLEPAVLKLAYDKDVLIGKLTFNLYGYSERNATKISKIEMPFTLLSSADVPEAANGELDVKQLGLACRISDPECNKYDMGFMQIATVKEDTGSKKTSLSLTSPIIPLGWFLHPSYLKENFADWAYGKCRTWFTSESDEMRKVIRGGSCPYTMAAAESDPGWYLKSKYLAGFPIDESQSSGNASASAEPAQTCFYSSVEDVAPNSYSAPASICCYRASDSTLLQNEFESPTNPLLHGSSVLHSHPFGSDYHQEHYRPGQVPYLSHWYWDKMPQLYCCHWWKGSACVNFYLKLRPAPQIRHQSADDRKVAYIYGPNVYPVSGGGPEGTLCSEMGEFWLIRSPAIEVQIRNYVVSSYTGPMPTNGVHHNSNFRVGGSRTPFVTAVAMRSMSAPEKIVELVCPDGEFRSYVQATDLHTWKTVAYDDHMGRGVGTHIAIGDAIADHSRMYSFLVKNGTNRVGIYAYVVTPGEEMMNMFITISSSLLANDTATGLAVRGGTCLENKVLSSDNRLFSSLCDNCEDFDKYSSGRPLYYENALKTTDGLYPKMPHTECSGDKTCRYIVWSTNYPPYYESSKRSMTSSIMPLIGKVGKGAVDACQNPNISGLYISEAQSFAESATIALTCLEPFKASTEGLTATCQKGEESLAFSVPQDFVCAVESKVVEEQEIKAAAADADYTKKHYTPEAQAGVLGLRPTRETAALQSVACGVLIIKWLASTAL